MIGWLIYGLVVGFIAKALHPGEEPKGILWTLGIGVAGSFVGGLLNFIMGFGGEAFTPAGFIMGIVGGVLFCFAYTRYTAGQLGSIGDFITKAIAKIRSFFVKADETDKTEEEK